MRLTAAEVAALTAGSVEGDGSVLLTGAEVDSRLLADGDLFVALGGARRDGHSFVEEVLVSGRVRAALVRSDASLNPPPETAALIRVRDPLDAYHRLARRVRGRMPWAIAAITGSVAKTTTKDFLATMLRGRFTTGASQGNRNNTLGLPAQLLKQPEDIDVFVAECGMNSAGELDTLGGILKPDLLLYTRITMAHTEFFDGLAEVAEAKAELIPYLAGDGTLVINAGDPLQEAFVERTTAKVLRYGAGDAEARVENLELLGLVGTRFDLVIGGERAPVELALPGSHQAENFLAAAAAASCLGLRVAEIAERAPALEAAPRRGRVHRLDDGIVLVDDTYNASPAAVERLLAMLATAPGRRVAVLGEMYELGESAPAEHRRAGEQAAVACDLLVAVGAELAAEMAAAAGDAGMNRDTVHHVEDAERASELLTALLRPNDVVMLKGSRGVGLDRTVDALTGGREG